MVIRRSHGRGEHSQSTCRQLRVKRECYPALPRGRFFLPFQPRGVKLAFPSEIPRGQELIESNNKRPLECTA